MKNPFSHCPIRLRKLVHGLREFVHKKMKYLDAWEKATLTILLQVLTSSKTMQSFRIGKLLISVVQKTLRL